VTLVGPIGGCDALGTYWDLVYQVLERAGGVPHAAVEGLAGVGADRGP
jgi:hypothetical protein